MSKKTNKFTIIELMISIIIFSMMLTMVMFFFTESQKAWQDSEGVNRVLQNSRTIFEVIEFDLIQAQATKTKGRTIPFSIVENKGDQNFGPFPYMVCKTSPSRDARSSLAEVSYTVGPIDDKSDQKTEDSGGYPMNYFKRSSLFDYKSGGGEQKDWDFYNIAPGTDVSWTGGASVNSYAVVGGLLDFKMSFSRLRASPNQYNERADITQNKYNNSTAPATAQKLNYAQMNEGYVYHSLPQYVDVELTLYDYITESSKKHNKTRRTFFKRIFLDQGSRAYDNLQLY